MFENTSTYKTDFKVFCCHPWPLSLWSYTIDIPAYCSSNFSYTAYRPVNVTHKNLLARLGTSVDLKCERSDPKQNLVLELTTQYSVQRLVPDGKLVTRTGNMFTINGLDRSKRGNVYCKTVSACNSDTEKIGYLVPLTPKVGMYVFDLKRYVCEVNSQ